MQTDINTVIAALKDEYTLLIEYKLSNLLDTTNFLCAHIETRNLYLDKLLSLHRDLPTLNAEVDHLNRIVTIVS